MSIKFQRELVLLFFVLVFSVFVSMNFISASHGTSTCYLYTSNASGQCDSSNGCIWKVDSWGSWCEELSCNSFSTQNDCDTGEVTGKNCTWQGGSSNSYCTQLSCYGWSGTNQTACENNTQSLSCDWDGQCQSSGGGNSNCWNIATEATCVNTTGCEWGHCRQKNCFDYTVESTCVDKKDPYEGRNCTWVSSTSSCTADNCYDTSLYGNISLCDANQRCTWQGSASTGYCSEPYCSDWDGNQSGCLNANVTHSKDCTYNSQWGFCNDLDCYSSATTAAACGAQSECIWQTTTSSGWCNEVNCWTWDSYNGGSESACNGNASLYGISCNWVNFSTANGTGWCESDLSNSNCTTYKSEQDCYNSYYCWWQANDWNNVSKGGNCTTPTYGPGNANSSIINQWNPGCYIFDSNQTECGNILGCDNSTTGTCELNGTHPYNESILANGLNCTIINQSGLCNSIGVLSKCCAWQSGACVSNDFDSTCWDDITATPGGEDSCDDATTKANCDILAGTPWYWPCNWDNSTNPAVCGVKKDDIWGNNTPTLVTIENRITCESIGGVWITENYCVGSTSVPTGRCEYRFDGETNCNKACFACEYKSGGGPHNNSEDARAACFASALGYCNFSLSSSAPNGFGICRAKTEFTTGVAGVCSAQNCGACTYKGDPNGANGTRTPEDWCKDFPADCKWEDDNSTTIGGVCIDKSAKTCKDACDRCDSQTKCANDGRTDVANVSGSCKWQGTTNDGDCVANIAGEVEICWNGEDDDSDFLIDCADPSCYGDSFCGMVSGDCFVWSDEANCNTDSECEWVTDSWGSFCDYRGSHCWQNDGNEEKCRGTTQINETLNVTSIRVLGNQINESLNLVLVEKGAGWVVSSINISNSTGSIISPDNYTVNYTDQTIKLLNTSTWVYYISNYTNVSYKYYKNSTQYCEWQNGTGSGWCEQDWTLQDNCFGISNETSCTDLNSSGCAWTNDTWCSSGGNSSAWCNNFGGWCDHTSFATQDCWQYTSNSSCSAVTNCNWQGDPYSQSSCDVNWSISTGCWNTTVTDCTAANGCWWNSNGNYCSDKFNECWQQYTQSDCNAVTNVSCYWQDYGGGGGTCQAGCYNQSTSSTCGGVSGCVWREDSGWCNEQSAQTCWNATNSNSETDCNAAAECNWRSPGWCNPKEGFNTGGGGGGGIGGIGECWKYDGNQTFCTNSTIINASCSFFPEPNPWCEVDWGAGGDCWNYPSVAGGCNVTNNCWYKSDSTGSYCTNIVDECWQNTSLSNNLTKCNEHTYCNSTGYGTCEPTCFSANGESECGSGCKWLTGWCNPAGMVSVFDEMETGGVVPLDYDGCGTEGISQESVDICGFGMKDMGDSYGFGATVYDVSNASFCDKVQITDHVQAAAGAGGSGFTDKTGDGEETVDFIVYLDADGTVNGSCAIESNLSAVGYEFKLRYSSGWNDNSSVNVETFTSHKCENGNWKASDIKTSAWKQKMCGDIGGPMIAIEKGELSRFPSLYVSTADLRIYMITMNNVTNITVPSDSAGPAYATPGAIDFAIGGAMDYGADAAKFENILQKGYVVYEDCYNGVDDDEDGNIDCSDWDCEFSSKCTGTGVNSPTFVDTKMPVLEGSKIEEYPVAALLMFDTSKPVNGTLKFYGNDSQCLTLNDTIFDEGVTKATVNHYKMWQEIAIYNDGDVNSLGYDLTSDTNYYYKYQICDTDNKCAQSKCTKFRTTTDAKCGYCNYVLRLKEPDGWNVSYDTNRDGTYDHLQGQVCGPNAGLKMNYTLGRSINVKMEKDDGNTSFVFLNVSVSKSGLNEKVRTLTASGDNLIGNTNRVGLGSQTRDKIINNLHPEVCNVEIPYTGTCDSIYHCDDSGNNCVNQTDNATLLDATACSWEIPSCQFSTYAAASDGSSGASPGSSGSPGGGGGGGGSSSGGATSTCGNGIIEGFEECDDGNLINGDGCDQSCKNEVQTSPPPGTGRAVDEGPSAGDGEGGVAPEEIEIEEESNVFFYIFVAILVGAVVFLAGWFYMTRWKNKLKWDW